MIEQTVSHYRIVEKVGEGSLGEVYLARDLKLRRNVILKLLPEELTKDETRKNQFLSEAQTAASVAHPYMAAIYNVDVFKGRVFIAMEYVKGKSLHETIRTKGLTTTEAIELAIQMADALSKAHERGVVHRSLHSKNVLITEEGYAKILDLGISKALEPSGLEPPPSEADTRTKTEEGLAREVDATMSPERIRGLTIDARSDIFSFGVILFEMLSGEHPFERPTEADRVSAILKDPPPPLKLKTPKASGELQHILRRALAKDPGERYQDVRDLAIDLRALRDETKRKKRGLRSWQLVATGTLLLVGIAAAGWWLSVWEAAPGPEATREPVSVLIADFDNRTRDPIFDGALEEALGIGLEGASFISSYRRAQARQQAAQLEPDASGRLDETLSQLVCRSQGIKVAVSGTIEALGEGYKISVRAFDPVTSERVAEASVDVRNKAEVLRAADALAMELRADLGDKEIASSRAYAEETFTTSSLEAMQAYARAQELMFLGEYDDAIAQYREAIAADADFGRAYSGLALRLLSLGEREKADEYFEIALAKIDRMSDREKYRTRGAYYVINYNHQKAIEEYTQLVELYPADAGGQANLALAHFYSRNMKEALRRGSLAAEIYPQSVLAHVNLAWYALYAGETDRAMEEAHIVMELNPSFEKTYVVTALSQLVQMDTTSARKTYEHLESLSVPGTSFASSGLADMALYEGRLTDAIKILEEGVAYDLAHERRAFAANKRAVLASAYLAAGLPEKALTTAAEAAAGGNQPSVLFQAAHVFVGAGNPSRAMELATQLGERLQPDPQAYAKVIEGEIKREAGNLRAAIGLFKKAQELSDTWLGRFYLGCALFEMGAYQEALVDLELCLSRGGEASAVFMDDIPSSRYLPPVYYYLGRAQEAMKNASANESYEKFLSIKEKADETPLVLDARIRLKSRS